MHAPPSPESLQRPRERRAKLGRPPSSGYVTQCEHLHPRAARRLPSRADPGSAGAQNWPALRLLLASRASGRPGAMGIPIRLAEAGGKAKSRGSLKSSNYVQVRCSDQVPWLHPLCCGARVCLLRTRMHGVPCSHLEARLTSQSRCAGRAAHSTGKNFRSASRPTALSSCSHRCSDEYVCTMVVRVRRARKATLRANLN